MNEYQRQVELLIKVLPSVAEERDFALHGGTAINLFIRDMPRLSIDVDLTYVPIEGRAETLVKIGSALERIESGIQRSLKPVRTRLQEDTGKLLVEQNGLGIKLEVNLTKRGTLKDTATHTLCDKAQKEFSAFAEVPVVSFGELYGGKVCAALDRQHPRDLFDVNILLESEGFGVDVREGFIFHLLGTNRPIHEILTPRFLDQSEVMDNRFTGMSSEPFTYEDFKSTRKRLYEVVRKSMTEDDKTFLLSVINCDPDWSIYDFERYPAIQWRLQNLNKLKEHNPDKHKTQFNALKDKLDE